MNLVLCMAGRYQRFRDRGYTTPKFLLPRCGKTILDHVLENLLAGGAFDRVLAVANHRDAAFAGEILKILRTHGVAGERLLLIDDTRGQAETARLGAQHLASDPNVSDERIIFHNIDTVLAGRDFHAVGRDLEVFDGYLDVFAAEGASYSYVAVDEGFQVTRIAEKLSISRLATSGLYGFRSHSEFIRYASDGPREGEYYISAVYGRMLEAGRRLTVNRSSEGHTTTVLGTPEEYEQSLKMAA